MGCRGFLFQMYLCSTRSDRTKATSRRDFYPQPAWPAHTEPICSSIDERGAYMTQRKKRVHHVPGLFPDQFSVVSPAVIWENPLYYVSVPPSGEVMTRSLRVR